MKKILTSIAVFSLIFNQIAFASTVALPADKRVFIELLQEIRAKDVQQGQTLVARVLDDVVQNRKTVIKSGTSVLVRVDAVKKRKIAGRQAELSLGAYETTAVDGQDIRLFGGYKKEGESRVALSVSLGVLILLPLIFIRGKDAVLPAGSVIDAFTRGSYEVAISDSQPSQRINLTRFKESMTAEVLYENLTDNSENFEFLIKSKLGSKKGFAITQINGASIKPIDLQNVSEKRDDEKTEVLSEVKIKKLIKKFRKGFNNVTISNLSNPDAESVEIMIDIEL